MTEETNDVEYTQEEMYQAFIKQLQESIDPRDYMTPTQREIMYLSLEDLEQEYNLVQTRQSNRGRMQRDLIVDRWNYEQTQNKQTETEQ